MDLSIFLRPYEPSEDLVSLGQNTRLIKQFVGYTGDSESLSNASIALIGVCDDRGQPTSTGSNRVPDMVRQELYSLFQHESGLNWIDMGNILPGATLEDTYFAVKEVCQELIKREIVPVVIGGSQDITLANYLAYEALEQTVNLVTIDYRLDFGQSTKDQNHKNYLNRVILHKPNYLFNYTNLGHQRYLTDPDLIQLMQKMYFDCVRLGEIQSAVAVSEPAIRNADIISMDMSSIRISEAPGTTHPGPNGFFGHEAAQLCRYAGMSDKLTSFGIYEISPENDHGNATIKLAAQMIWCFMEGYSHRKGDYPKAAISEYTKYIVPFLNEGHELVFYKSDRSDRWWLEVPYTSQSGGMNYERHHVVPCSYENYLQATREEIPDLWWRTYQKLT
jgi:arginase family enzyme